MKKLKIFAILICLIATSSSFAFTYDKKITVGNTGEDYLTIQEAINNCDSRCEIEISSGTYYEQVSLNKDSVWLHGDLDDPTAVTIQYLDTLSTYPHDNDEGENKSSFFPDQNGVVRMGALRSRLSHVTLDAVRKYAFQWTKVWGASYQFYGNSGITFPSGAYNQIDHCEIKNAWYGVFIKGRNTGGVFANLEDWEIEEGQAATPFSNFGKTGGHYVEYNKIYDNVWGVFTEQIYDLGSVIRYNLLWDNFSVPNDFICNDTLFCGDPNAAAGDKKYHVGGFIFLKDAMLVTHEIYGNTTFNMPHFIAGYHKAGKNHNVYNNLIAHRNAPITNSNYELFNGYSNATNNVIEANTNNEDIWPLFGPATSIWSSKYLSGNDGTVVIDSFSYSGMGEDNFYYKEIEFLSTDPSDPNFLCPDWSKANVQRSIKGNIWEYTSGLPVGTIGDAGALWSNGTSSCVPGGSTDSISIRIAPVAPIIFTDDINATFQFDLLSINTDDSNFVGAKYSYSAFIDSIPSPDEYTSPGSYMFPQAEELGDGSGISGIVRFGTNNVNLKLQREDLGEYGVIYLAVDATYSDGTVYRSNVQAFEYRRLDYTIKINFYRPTDLALSNPLDTIAKGDTVIVTAQILDLNLKPAPAGILFFGAGSNPDSASFKSPVISSLLNNSFKVIEPFPAPISEAARATIVVTGSTWGNEIATVSGYTYEATAGSAKTNFATGIKSVFIIPAYASTLEVEANDLPRSGDTITVSVNVKDLFGDICADSIAINIKSDDLTTGKTHGPVSKINSDGTVEFQIIITGAPSDTLSITATAISKGAGEITGNLTVPIQMPLGKVLFASENDSVGFATGQIFPLDLIFKADNGTEFTGVTSYTLELYNSKNVLSEDILAFDDSLYATINVGEKTSGNGIIFAYTDSIGEAKLWITTPDTLSSSETYRFITKDPNNSSEYWDTLYVSFAVPELVFLDENDNILDMNNLPKIDTTTNEYVKIKIRAMVNGIICTACNDMVTLIGGDAFGYVNFKTQEGTPDINQIMLEDGEAEFVVYGKKQALGTSFTVSTRGGISSSTWDDIDFKKPPVPQVDSALVFDVNGDGIADSIAIFYEESIVDSLPDSLFYAYPGVADPTINYPNGTNIVNDSTIGINDPDMIDYILTDGVGLLQSWYTDEDGEVWRQPVDIFDRIGPVIISADVVENYGSGADSLIVVFSEPIDPTFSSGNPFTIIHEGIELTPTAMGEALDDTTWVFTLGKNIVQPGNDISIIPTGGIVDLEKNVAHFDNGPIDIGLIRRPIPTSETGNEFQDYDSDGTMDHMVIKFLGDITQDYLDTEMDSIVFVWLDSAGSAIRLVAMPEELMIDPDNPRLLHWTVPNPDILAPHMTYIDNDFKDSSKVYGSGTMYATIEDTKHIMTINMTDGMPPVIWKATLTLGKKATDDDKLVLLFSENINPTVSNYEFDGSEFEIITPDLSSFSTLQYSSKDWTSPSELELTFGKSVPYNDRPSSMDIIRIASGALRDLEDNVPITDELYIERNPQETLRPGVVIRGNVRFKTETLYQTTFGAEDDEIINAEPMSTSFVEFNTTRDDNPYLGVMMGIGGQDLVYTIQDALKNKYYKDSDATDIEINPANLVVKQKMHIFTAIGGYVAHTTETISCDDSNFSDSPETSATGNCFETPKKTFLQWNFKSVEKRLVGTGAFVAKLYYKITYKDSKGTITIGSGESSEVWGVVRRNGYTMQK